jgi:O-acetyl-ADP-ribose deacetylase (regulator of RNase III)/NAD-dependent SIR2 family protein deacetylase
MSIITDTEAIRYILMHPNDQTSDRHPYFACYLGAGASAEAGVKLASQICTEIYEDLLNTKLPSGSDDKVQLQAFKETLNWNDLSLRYVSCLKEGYPDPSLRVEYFRNLLRGLNPSFAHHALALLITHRYFKSSCLTTNFAKLLENAFIQQGDYECQPIRTTEELEFWANVEGRHYVIKLHGDYDTLNVLNTREETVTISEPFQRAVARLLNFAGLVVIGAAGYEKSIHTMFDVLGKKAEEDQNVLRFGLLWGVYMGPSKPAGLVKDDIERLVKKKLKDGAVNGDIIRMIQDTQSKGRLFYFFPVWGAANFMYDLLKATKNRELIGTAERYLDREMRLRHVFTRAGLSEHAINKHLSTLELKRTHLISAGGERRPPEEACRARSKQGQVELRILYGDITSRTFMNSGEFQALCRAVMSPDDTFITAGGGVAEGLLDKCGRQFMLNELAKFGVPVDEGTVAVTSGGNLPVHYLFHAAAITVEKQGSYSVSKQSVYKSMMSALRKAAALKLALCGYRSWGPELQVSSLTNLLMGSLRQYAIGRAAMWDRLSL